MPDQLVDIALAARSQQVNASALESALRASLKGDVRFDAGSRALYATDGSNYRQVPIGVVLPRDNEDVLSTIALCREYNAPLLCRGGGTSLAGQCCNVAVVLDFSRYMANILEIDPARRIARIQPGIVLDVLRNAAEKHHLTFGPDPATHDRCTLGGMIGNNSCGVHSVMAGKTVDNIESLEVVTYDGVQMTVGPTSPEELQRIIAAGGRRGEIYSRLKSIGEKYATQIREKYVDIPRRVSGYNLNYLLPENGFNIARALVGTEGTCVTVLEATCRLVQSPPERVLLVIAYPDIYECADRVPEIMAHKPIGLEGFDDLLVGYTRKKGINTEGLALLPEGNGWLLVEFGADTIAEAEAQARGLMDALSRGATKPNMRLLTNKAQQKNVWIVRESSLGVTSHVPGEPLNWEGWEDAAVNPKHLGGYLRDLRKMMASFGYKGSLYGHFGEACVHTRMNFDLVSKEGIARFRKFMEEAADLVIHYGGSLSGEHGDGQSRAELLPKMFGPELIEAFREFKSAWDPAWKMNPGKVIEPYKLDENLRLGANYAPWRPETHFKFPDDHGSLAAATVRCVGVGKCRRDEGGVMCPSYRATREEVHSTRGRAHLLWEMTTGEREDSVIKDGWKSEEVKDSLDLCLACKGCKSDCPVAVDVATYKAEFLSHYYEGRLRPVAAYAFGNIDLWARIGSKIPGLVNLTTQLPILRDIAKFVAGIPNQREIPAFAPQTFRSWFNRNRNNHPGAPFLASSARSGDSGSRTNSEAANEKMSTAADENAFGWRSASSAAIKATKNGGASAPEGTSAQPWKSGASAPRDASEEKGALAPEVLLWPDTFNNYFLPATAKAAVNVLEAAGFHVTIPQSPLCCGRPLYDWGMLDRAKTLLLQILDALEPQIKSGTPIVGLEPSCVAVFRDELCNLFPNDPRAQALKKQTFLLSEFLEQHAKDFPLPQLNAKALIHGHCHHKSLMKMTAEESVLRRLGIDFTAPAPGCCGMAGAFGFERDKYEVSAAIGELELLPAVRQAEADTLIIANGFSCREQIAQGTDRQALHLAEVLDMALQKSAKSEAKQAAKPGLNLKAKPHPESRTVYQRQNEIHKSMTRTAATLGAIGVGAVLLWNILRHR